MAKQVMRPTQVTSLSIKGYKSIKHVEALELRNLNVLIGANGVGKSNFISLFRLLNFAVEKRLQYFVSKAGSPDSLLYFGRKSTPRFDVELYFGNNGYQFTLEPTADNKLMFARENLYWNVRGPDSLGSGHFETKIDSGIQKNIADYVVEALKNWRVYHFHDTGESSPMKQIGDLQNNDYLRPDASNLAAFLFLIRESHSEDYEKIVKTIQLMFPSFGDFNLRPLPTNKTKIQLEWKEKNRDEIFLGHQLSDGTLRFICLATLLLQPEEYLPATILIDEPELGLHPYAIKLLGGLLKSAGVTQQIIVSTQSVELLDEFTADDVIVVNREKDQSTFSRPKADELKSWLENYTLGQLWKTNVLGGRP